MNTLEREVPLFSERPRLGTVTGNEMIVIKIRIAIVINLEVASADLGEVDGETNLSMSGRSRREGRVMVDCRYVQVPDVRSRLMI
jgi:hypothetical protein